LSLKMGGGKGGKGQKRYLVEMGPPCHPYLEMAYRFKTNKQTWPAVTLFK
jgi:hypothetical protein